MDTVERLRAENDELRRRLRHGEALLDTAYGMILAATGMVDPGNAEACRLRAELEALKATGLSEFEKMQAENARLSAVLSRFCGPRTLCLEPVPPTTGHWSRDPRVLVSGCRGRAARRDPAGPLLVRGRRLPVTGTPVAWSPDLSRLVTVGSGVLAEWDAESGARLSDRPGTALAWHPSGPAVAHAGRIELPCGKELPVPRGLEVDGLLWSPDHAMLAAAVGNAVLIWFVSTGTTRWLPSGHAPPMHMSWSPDNSRLAVSISGGRVVAWDVSTGTATASVKASPRALGLAWAPDNARLAIHDADRVWVWPLGPGVQVLNPGIEAVAVGFAPQAGRAVVFDRELDPWFV